MSPTLKKTLANPCPRWCAGGHDSTETHTSAPVAVWHSPDVYISARITQRPAVDVGPMIAVFATTTDEISILRLTLDQAHSLRTALTAVLMREEQR